MDNKEVTIRDIVIEGGIIQDISSSKRDNKG
jgi:hypothetical protein